MEVIIGVIALIFGFRLIGPAFFGLFALIGLLFRLWFFAIALIVIALLFSVGGHGDGHGSSSDTTQYQSRETKNIHQRIETDQNTSANLSWWEWLGYGTCALSMVVAGGVWLRFHWRRRSANQTVLTTANIATFRRPTASADTLNRVNHALITKGNPRKPIELLSLGDSDIKLMARFRQRFPWVLVDVPPKFAEAFVRECEWFRQKTKRYPSEEDQVAVLREVSSGWTWNIDSNPGVTPHVEESGLLTRGSSRSLSSQSRTSW